MLKMRDQLRQLLGQKPLSIREIAIELGNSNVSEIAEELRKIGAHYDNGRYSLVQRSEEEVEEEIPIVEEDAKKRKLKSDRNDLRRRYEAAITENNRLKRQLEQQKITNEKPIEANLEFATPLDGKKEATPLILASDWHPAKIIDPETVNGLNQHNSEISKQRIQKFFSEVYQKNQILRSEYTINQVVLWLGGDLINNFLRPEDRDTNELHPAEESLLTQSMIKSGIDLLLEDPNIERVFVPCTVGNHGRFPETKKPNVNHPMKESLEYLVYANLAREYANESRVEFYIPDSIFLEFYIYSYKIRANHGHGMKISSSGLEASMEKEIDRWNRNLVSDQVPDLDIIGHFHSLRRSLRGLANGSSNGADPWQIYKGFPIEPPQQAYQLVEKEKGFTMLYKIRLD
jgi:hypothetical protein